MLGETDELVSLVVLTDRWWALARELVAQLRDARQVLIARAIQSVRLAQFRCEKRRRRWHSVLARTDLTDVRATIVNLEVLGHRRAARVTENLVANAKLTR